MMPQGVARHVGGTEDDNVEKWIECGMVGGAAVVARREGNAVRVRALRSVDSSREVRERVEHALNAWVSPLRAHAWRDTETGDAVEQVVALYRTQPTHRIEFREGINPPDDAPPTYVDLVFLDAENADDESTFAYDRSEWETESAARWCVERDVWLCDGNATPGGANGTAIVTRLPVGE